jgi:TIR domain
MPDPDLFLFVSHVSEDQPAALEIVDELERRGVPCWIAPRDVHPGRPFDDEIAEAIEASRAMLLIFSDRCNEHDYIRREVTVAGESHKIIIPFRIEDAQPRRGLRVRLSDLHWIDGFVSRERAIDQVVREIDPERARRQQKEHRRAEEQRRGQQPRPPQEMRFPERAGGGRPRTQKASGGRSIAIASAAAAAVVVLILVLVSSGIFTAPPATAPNSTGVSAKPLAPGQSLFLQGTTMAVQPQLLGRAIIQKDNVTEFSILNGTNEQIFVGKMQDRVAKTKATGNLVFETRIQDTRPAHITGWRLTEFCRTGFKGLQVDVDFRTDGLGEVGQSTARRSGGDGDEICFKFLAGAGIKAGSSSYFFYIATTVKDFAPSGGRTTLMADNYSTNLPSAAPSGGGGGVVRR